MVEAELDDAVAAVRVMGAGNHALLPEFAEAIGRRCRQVAADLAETAAGPGPGDDPDLDDASDPSDAGTALA